MAAVLFSTAILVCLLPVAVLSHGFPAALKLERAIPANHEMEISQLKARDRARHGRLLQSLGGVVDFPVDGTFDPFVVGLYYTKLRLGSPPRDFHVQIDTGSDVLWVSCASCNGCPQTSGLQIQLNYFDPGSSVTATPISCSDQRCSWGVQSSDSGCSVQNNLCAYTFQYGDGSGTSGFYVSDVLQFDMIVGSSLVPNSTAQVVFGCSTSQTGDLVKSDRAVDGIFGFGQQGMSVISQLASQGVAPRVFSHCLKGENGGGGILVLGEIVEPNMVFTPLVPSQPHYNVNLLSISVNGQALPINPSVFSTSNGQGTIIDTGTTLAYLSEAAYVPFVEAITNAVSQSVRPVVSKGNQCYVLATSVADVFPPVSLNFAGGASMFLNPQDYLIQQNNVGGTAVWCIGFQRIQNQGITILGDLVLKDKIFVYDLVGQRIGWANYDCSMSVNVSATSSSGRSEYVNAGQFSDNAAPQKLCLDIVGNILMLILMVINLFLEYTAFTDLPLCSLCTLFYMVAGVLFVVAGE